MAVVSVATFTVPPDRMEEFIEAIRKGKVLTEKHGGRNCRLLSAVVAGEATGSMAFVTEVDDFAGWGAVNDGFFGDPEGSALVALAASMGYQSALWVDVPLGGGPFGSGLTPEEEIAALGAGG